MTLVDILRDHAIKQPNAIAFRFHPTNAGAPTNITFLELYRRSLAWAARISGETHVSDRVLIALPSGIEYLVAFFGCLLSKRIAVPHYPPRLNATSTRHLNRLQAIAHDCTPALALGPAGFDIRFRRTVSTVPELSGLRWLSVDSAIAEAPAVPDAPRERPTDDDVALLQYTSGSTREPRGVIISHENLRRNLALCARAFRVGRNSILSGWLPLFHDMGLIGLALQAVYSGCPYVFMPPSSFIQRPLSWLRLLSEARATCTGAPNFAFELCADRITADVKETLDLSSVDMMFCGAEQIRPASLHRFIRACEPFALKRSAIAPGYGLAEATLVVSLDTGARGPNVADRPAGEIWRGKNLHVPVVDCGEVQPEYRIAIVDPTTKQDLEPGAIGEIWLAGQCVSRGYWGEPNKSQDVFGNALSDSDERSWLRTGDLGFLRGRHLFVTGRLKDIIAEGNAYRLPDAIENTVLTASEFIEPNGTAAFGLANDQGTRVVIVAEIRRAARNGDMSLLPSILADAIFEAHGIANCDIVLTPPRCLPRTTSGKLQRSQCRSLYEHDQLPVIARLRRAKEFKTNSAALDG
ncbi:MAG TPA: fatty acyl-AMP ligase [Terriglobales bacterium]|jgi:acyl-CoA synthetase (AMP-forming)/AMP-acid ligase II|nr:fatty acyl-AMP ligase [Terriglobales bacterium]